MQRYFFPAIISAIGSLLVALPVHAEWNAPTLEAVVDSLDVYWGVFLGTWGVDYKYPIVYPHPNVQPTPCGPASYAHYCINSNTIHLNMPQMGNLAFGIGDAAAYFAVAHEYGHSVQNQLGLLNAGIPIPVLELQADCLAGAFFAGADYAGMVESGDLDESMFSAFYHGDFDFYNPQHHGTPQQRAEAFATGYLNTIM